jgi:GNAT superfamily N-acetyltransferase
MRRVMTAVREVDRSEFPTLARTFARAFDDDPVMAWFLPNEQKRPARIEKFFRDVELGGPFGRDGLVCATDGLAAGAIWLPPGKWRLGGWDQLRTLPQFLRHISWRHVPSRVAAFQQIEQRHPPEPLHWYLATLGTDPVRQGQGLGSALLADQLARCDADGLPSYLESSKEANVPFYERHGFVVTETLDLPDGPRLWLMWRDPLPPSGNGGSAG